MQTRKRTVSGSRGCHAPTDSRSGSRRVACTLGCCIPASGTEGQQSHRSITESGFPHRVMVPSEGYTHTVCTTCGRRHQGSVLRAAVLVSKAARLAIFSGTEEETGASSLVIADKKAGRIMAEIFALT
ncbi:hypothetical protein Tco_0200483 [Tanacetum coccineum]